MQIEARDALLQQVRQYQTKVEVYQDGPVGVASDASRRGAQVASTPCDQLYIRVMVNVPDPLQPVCRPAKVQVPVMVLPFSEPVMVSVLFPVLPFAGL